MITFVEGIAEADLVCVCVCVCGGGGGGGGMNIASYNFIIYPLQNS